MSHSAILRAAVLAAAIAGSCSAGAGPAAPAEPDASELLQQAPARVICDAQGRPRELIVLVPEPGVLRFQLPPDLCRRAPAARPPAAGPRPRLEGGRTT